MSSDWRSSTNHGGRSRWEDFSCQRMSAGNEVIGRHDATSIQISLLMKRTIGHGKNQSGRYLQRAVGVLIAPSHVASHFASHVVAYATALLPVTLVASRRTYLIRCDRCDGATAGLDSNPKEESIGGDEQTDVRPSCKSDHRADNPRLAASCQ
jgi:hypothetical protein